MGLLGNRKNKYMIGESMAGMESSNKGLVGVFLNFVEVNMSETLQSNVWSQFKIMHKNKEDLWYD